ncbi:MAG: hypothetical protein N2255_06320 [Kiritimatiellae bacterium]|nr:hypothetical protein [Kiritimatiellia bacterium]
MPKPFRIRLFGKPGCDKCSVLNERLDRLLADPRWDDFEKEYCNVETEDGLVALCEAECIDPRRIPALLILRKNEGTGEYEPLPNRDARYTQTNRSRLYCYLGLQTDYSETGRGVITPAMIADVLTEASKYRPASTPSMANAAAKACPQR